MLGGLGVLLRPLCWLKDVVFGLRRRFFPRRADPPMPVARSSFSRRGPEAPEPPDNDYYHAEVRGANARRVQNHGVVVIDGCTARLERGPQKAKPVNRHRLKLHFARVASCSEGCSVSSWRTTKTTCGVYIRVGAPL